MHAEQVGQMIGKQDLIGIPFAGGLSELPHLQARQILVNDKNRLLLNLCRVLVSKESELLEMLHTKVFHPAELQDARGDIQNAETSDLDLAAATFVNNWMCRCSGGTKSELNQPIATRFTASGGSSIVRWKNAVAGLPTWAKLLRERCECTCLDWREFASKWKDRKGHALYLDPPWIGAGEEYLHGFTALDHGEMWAWVNDLKKTTVVVRHSDCEDYRRMYSVRDGWVWHQIDGKNQAGNATGEVLIRRAGEV